MTVKIGTKYSCPKCQSEFIVMKIGKTEFKCCDQPLEVKK